MKIIYLYNYKKIYFKKNFISENIQPLINHEMDIKYFIILIFFY